MIQIRNRPKKLNFPSSVATQRYKRLKSHLAVPGLLKGNEFSKTDDLGFGN